MEHDKLGPLAGLVGIWEGPKGLDVAPGPELEELRTPFSERMTFEFLGEVNNHGQTLWGLRYRTEVTRSSDGVGFHEDMGYWLWDAERGQVMRSFVVPRGIAVLAGGTAAADSRSFTLAAERGASVYGVAQNAFLEHDFRIERFSMKVSIEDGAFAYEEDTVMRLAGREELFHHTDACRLERLA